MDRNSMLIWYPVIRHLDIPQPKTEMYLIPVEVLDNMREENLSKLNMETVKTIARNIGYPLFLRTDQSSAKHSWKDTSFVESEKNLKDHIFEVVLFNLCADIMGLPFEALVFREYIPMDSKFTAFDGDMPVNPERRYFINNGKVLCHHNYWIEEAIERSKEPSVKNWRELSQLMSIETDREVELLTKYSEMVGEWMKGYWSIDFCRAKDGRWILIDMASGFDSWHPECDKKIKETEHA